MWSTTKHNNRNNASHDGNGNADAATSMDQILDDDDDNRGFTTSKYIYYLKSNFEKLSYHNVINKVSY